MTEPVLVEGALVHQARFMTPELIGGKAVALEVRDQGPGMSPEVQARMFEPFFSTRFRGRGLGLAVVLGIVRAHKGAIFVKSEPNQGTTMRVLLPLAVEASQAITRATSTPAAGPLPPPAILIADDEEAVRTVTSRMLETAGYRVIAATDGRDVVEKFRQNGPAVRLVLLDLTMPNQDGEGAFRQLRQMQTNLPVILMSGYPKPDVMKRFADAGLTAFLQKPFRPAELLDLVRQHFPER